MPASRSSTWASTSAPSLGPIVTGRRRPTAGWRAGFAAGGVGMVFGLVQFKVFAALPRQRRPHAAGATPSQQRVARWIGVAWSCVVVVIVALAVSSATRAINPRCAFDSCDRAMIALAVGYFAYMFFFAGLDDHRAASAWA